MTRTMSETEKKLKKYLDEDFLRIKRFRKMKVYDFVHSKLDFLIEVQADILSYGTDLDPNMYWDFIDILTPHYKRLDSEAQAEVAEYIPRLTMYARESALEIIANEVLEVFLELKNPTIEQQKRHLEMWWCLDAIHEKFNNDEFLKSKWIRMMKLKNGSLEKDDFL